MCISRNLVFFCPTYLPRLLVRNHVIFNSSSASVAKIPAVNRASIGSDIGFCSIRYQANIYKSVGLLSMGPLGTKFTGIRIKIQDFSLMKMHLKISSAKRRQLHCKSTVIPDSPLLSNVSQYNILFHKKSLMSHVVLFM